MRKIVSFILAITLVIPNIIGQSKYNVITVKGKITITQSGNALKTGSSFLDSDPLFFHTKESKAVVINPNKGRLTITAQSYNLNEMEYNPPLQVVSLRSWGKLDSTNLKKNFCDTLVVLGEYKMAIDEKSYKLDSTHFFLLDYTAQGKNIRKKIPVEGNNLVFDRNELFVTERTPIPRPIQLPVNMLYSSNQAVSKISSLYFVFPVEPLLKNEVSVIITTMKGKSVKEKKQAVESYISDFYGKTVPENLDHWLKLNLGI
jgi:hypothetical protein